MLADLAGLCCILGTIYWVLKDYLKTKWERRERDEKGKTKAP